MTKVVLLVEDEARYRESIKYLFRGEPYQFVEAESPEEGIKSLEENSQIQVILLGLSFPHKKGTAVLHHLKKRSGDYRVIVLTAHDNLLHAERAGEYDIFHYLPKAERSSNQAIRFSIEQAFKDLEREHLDRKRRFLLDVQTRIADNRPLDETLDFICESVLSTVGAFTCHIRLYDSKRGDYHLHGFAGAKELRQVFAPPRAKGRLFSGWVVETGKPEIFGNLQNLDKFRLFADNALEGRANVSPEERHYWRTVQSAYIVPISTHLFETEVDAVLNV